MTERPSLSDALGERYRVVRELGAGGMATVYLADDLRHHRQVALKVLRPELASSLGAERFLREIEIAAGLQHPHILPLFDSGGRGDVLFYVMPFVEGESLRDRISRTGALSLTEAVHLLREIADALAYAHRRGLIHRDIKPENVLLADGHALVTDFGIAKAVSEASPATALTGTGIAMGTPAYMAPEQAMADPGLDHRVDVYAFGVIAYEMIAGRAPFGGNTAQQIIAAHLTRTPEPLSAARASVPPVLASLVSRCLEKAPADRVQDAGEIVRLLDTIATSGGANVETTASSAATSGHRRRGRRVMIGAALAMLVVVVVGGTLYTEVGRAGTLIGAAALNENDLVLVAEFQNRTTDSTLAATITDAVRTEVQQSRAVRVLSQQAMWGALTRMQLARGTPLAESAVRELAEREGAKAYIVGDVAHLGSGYQITARVVATREGSDALTARATAASDADLISAVEKVGHALRRSIGESLRSVAATAPLAQVTTASLPALRAYTIASRAETDGDRPTAITMAKQALVLDSAFASAWALLYVTYSNMGRVADAMDAASHAYALRHRLSDVQRLQTEARYHKIQGDAPAEEAAWAGLAELGVPSGLSNYSNMLMEHGRLAEAESMARRAVAANPKSTIALWNLAESQVAQHRFRAADSTAALARAQIPDNDYRYWIELYTILGRRDLDSAERYLESPSGARVSDGGAQQCVIDLQRGRMRRWRNCRQSLGTAAGPFVMLLLAEFRLTSDSASALRGIRDFLSVAPSERDPDSYGGAVALLADVGRVNDARRLLDEWRARVGVKDPSFRADSALAVGAIAAAERKWVQAAESFLAWNAAPSASAVHWYNRGLPEAAEMLQRAGKADSAIALGERALAKSSMAAGMVYEATWYVQLLELLGDLYAARGDRVKAAGYYRTYLDVLKDAEPPIAAQVATVRERLAQLTGEPTRR